MLHVYAARMEKYGSNLSHSNAWLPRNPPTSRAKLALQNCKGDVNAWSRVLFQLANRDFPHECTNLYCFFLPCLNMKSEKQKSRSAKTAAKLITTGIDFLNNISAAHTSLIQVYRCHKTLNRNYHEVVCEVIERASNSSTGKRRAWLVRPSLDFWVCFLCLFFTVLADLISFLQIQSWQPAGSSSTFFLGYFLINETWSPKLPLCF